MCAFHRFELKKVCLQNRNNIPSGAVNHFLVLYAIRLAILVSTDSGFTHSEISLALALYSNETTSSLGV